MYNVLLRVHLKALMSINLSCNVSVVIRVWPEKVILVVLVFPASHVTMEHKVKT